MDIKKDWVLIKRHVSRCFSTNLHVSIASVDQYHHPTVTPIGSLFLNHDGTGFYFEKYTTQLPANARQNDRICVLAVNSGKWFWLKSLFNGKFSKYPALKLYGTLGQRRKPAEEEIHRLSRRMRRTKGLKGHRYLWGDMPYVREIVFDKVEKINLGAMTAHL